MILKKIIDFNMDQNCYIIKKEENNECIVIDPGCGVKKVLDYVKENNFYIKSVLLTHCHYDHSAGIPELKKNFDLKVYASKECSENIKSPIINVSNMFGKDLGRVYVDEILNEGEFDTAGIRMKCIKTPGHTSGSVCFFAEDNLFTGDTLFLRTVGRWDLPTGKYDELENSLRNKIYVLDENIKVFPGHGNDTLVGYEKKFNMSINGQER